MGKKEAVKFLLGLLTNVLRCGATPHGSQADDTEKKEVGLMMKVD